MITVILRRKKEPRAYPDGHPLTPKEEKDEEDRSQRRRCGRSRVTRLKGA
jgi:hypothetical protein